MQQRAAGSSSFWLLQGCYPLSKSPKFHIQRSQVSHSIAPLGLVVSDTEVASLPLELGVYLSAKYLVYYSCGNFGRGCLQAGAGRSESLKCHGKGTNFKGPR